MKKISKIFSRRFAELVFSLFKCVIAYVYASFLKKETAWIICERRDEARDNGLHLFKYVINHCSSQKIYYVIDKKSPDRLKVAKISDNLINFGSIKHWILFYSSPALISTHINGYVPNDLAFRYTQSFFKPRGKKVFLQHGIIKDNLPKLYYEKTNLDLFVCGAKPEYDYICKNFHYPKNIVKYLGLCRYDNLFNNKLENIILVMPTFRMEYFVPNGEKISKEMEQKFLSESFYKNYSAILNSKKINDTLKKNNYTMVFYPHHEMQKYLNYFHLEQSNIKIADVKSEDIQSYLKKSKMLITDYSSVFFDFGFMKKKILFFQFDYDEYRKGHYQEGYFDYKDEIFGRVIDNSSEMIDEICSAIEDGCVTETTNIKKINKFFVLNDTNNCKRNYEAIRSIVLW